jgi:hypothetical protein
LDSTHSLVACWLPRWRARAWPHDHPDILRAEANGPFEICNRLVRLREKGEALARDPERCPARTLTSRNSKGSREGRGADVAASGGRGAVVQ